MGGTTEGFEVQVGPQIQHLSICLTAVSELEDCPL